MSDKEKKILKIITILALALICAVIVMVVWIILAGKAWPIITLPIILFMIPWIGEALDDGADY